MSLLMCGCGSTLSIVKVLRETRLDLFVPAKKKAFLKFWWDESLDRLKQESTDTARVWKTAGKPRSGAICQKYQAARSAYRSGLREHQKLESTSYSNDLHAALSHKTVKNFGSAGTQNFNRRLNTSKLMALLTNMKLQRNVRCNSLAHAAMQAQSVQLN
jgi:hypothetical protein